LDEKRYLELLRRTLLNEIYIENDVRFLYLFATMSVHGNIDGNVVRQIGRHKADWLNGVKDARREGRPWWLINYTDSNAQPQTLNLRSVCDFNHTMVGRLRLENLEKCLDVIRLENIPGDVAETGAWRGGASIFMKGYLQAYALADRNVWVADSFEGMPVPSLPQDAGWDFSPAKVPILAVSLEEVQENFRRYDLLDESVKFLKGWFCDTLPQAPIEKLSLLRLDGDLYESTMDALNALYDKVVPGGFVIVDDYGDFEPCHKAITEFRDTHGITAPLEEIDWSGVFWRKTESRPG
jgi:O-methyltransferase